MVSKAYPQETVKYCSRWPSSSCFDAHRDRFRPRRRIPFKPQHHAPPRVQIQRLMWLDQGLRLKQRHYLAYTLFAVHRPMLGDGTCKFSTLIANSTTSVASYSTHGPYEWNGCQFTGGGSYISQENGQTPPFAVDVGFRPDFGRRSGVLSHQAAKSGSPPTS